MQNFELCRGEFVSDFDLMMMRKKEEMKHHRRKRKDIDLINDNDDIIADMITKMKEAAEVRNDCESYVSLTGVQNCYHLRL